VKLVHVFDLYSHDAFQVYVRPISEVVEEQQNVAQAKPNSFLKSEFPPRKCSRILLSGDSATQITHLAARHIDRWRSEFFPDFVRPNLLVV
jgi:hypothetical protein